MIGLSIDSLRVGGDDGFALMLENVLNVTGMKVELKNINLEVYGGPGNDVLVGGLGSDRLFGEAGDDVLWGG